MAYVQHQRGVPAWAWMLFILIVAAAVFWWFFAIQSTPPGAAAAKGDTAVVWRTKGERFYTVTTAPPPVAVTHLPHMAWADNAAARVASITG